MASSGNLPALDADRLSTLRTALGDEQVSLLYSKFCSDLDQWIEAGSFVSAEAHSHLGAALNLGAGCLADALRRIEAHECTCEDASAALSRALSELRDALARHRLLDHAG